MAIRETIGGLGGNSPAPSLDAFLVAFLGAWPEAPGLHIVGSDERTQPGWDGSIRRIVGVGNPSHSVISVPPALVDAVRTSVPTWADIPGALPAAVGQPAGRTFFGKFRWTTAPTDLPDAGVWVPTTDPRVPEWLLPFNGDVLIAFIDGVYAAGVGIKRHNAAGLELSVGTDEAHRGKGLASRLVAQAARWVLAQGAVPIYLHDPANTASDRTALAAGFPDEGWKIIGVWGGE